MILSYTKGSDENVTVELGDRPITIGRSTKADIVIDDERASRLHCGIRLVDGNFVLKDLASKNGTFVNDERVESHVLRANDVIRVGGTVFRAKSMPSRGATTAFQEVEQKMSGGKGYDTILKEIIGESGQNPK